MTDSERQTILILILLAFGTGAWFGDRGATKIIVQDCQSQQHSAQGE